MAVDIARLLQIKTGPRRIQRRPAEIGLLDERELNEADAIVRLAFGTLFGLPNPHEFMGDADILKSRWRADRSRVFAAHIDGRLVGVNVATRWGSFGFFGPLAVHPEFWGEGIGSKLMAPIIDLLFAKWQVTGAGLFTVPFSPKHLSLYQAFDFWPGKLTPLLEKAVVKREFDTEWRRYSSLPADEQSYCLRHCAELTDQIYPGLDLQSEILTVVEQGLGDALIIYHGGVVDGFAVCHAGAGSEAGTGKCYVKFGAVLPGEAAGDRFSALLDVCERFALESRAESLSLGINTERTAAYRLALQHGFVLTMIGVAMEKAEYGTYNRSDVFVIDDCR